MDDEAILNAEAEEAASDATPIDPKFFDLLLGPAPNEEDLFERYRKYVINDGLLPYKQVIQYSLSEGGKAGESLYNHVLNGILVLQHLRGLLQLSDEETKVLFTAFTIHDINKVQASEQYQSYLELTKPNNVVHEMSNVKLDEFFEGYEAYLNDIISLMQRHSGHTWTGVQALNLNNQPKFKLPMDRLDKLVLLMRAADGIDLSQTLEEQRHKDQFLHSINTFSNQQYTFWRHRVAEQRGSFSNIIHNAVVEEINQRFGLIPLLYYPDGVAYLQPKGHKPTLDSTVRSAIAARVADTINEMTSAGFREFIRAINMGITVDRKCLELNLPFAKILAAIDAIIQRRMVKADKMQALNEASIKRTRELLAKRQAKAANPSDQQATKQAIEAILERGPVPQTNSQLQLGELIRSYYIFLIEHCEQAIPDAWQHLYQLLDLPAERWAVYDGFDARMDRAYAIATELQLTSEQLYTNIEADGSRLIDSQTTSDPRLATIDAYLQHVLVFDGQERSAADFAGSLPNYVRQNYKQCVQCSLPMKTDKWGSANVRSDIKIQMFSNRLVGGPGEPVKHICELCLIQYLVEKLNYREISGERTIYLHMFPYSFLPAPLLESLRSTFQHLTREDTLTGAVRLNDVSTAILAIAQKRAPTLNFTMRTKADKAQPYGLYSPRYSKTLGGLITLPLNPAGETDTERFLFALQHALLLQHHFGCKVLLSAAAVPPLSKEAFGDVYVDLTPLHARGFVRQNDYEYFAQKSKDPGSLSKLWQQLEWLYQIREVVALANADPVVDFIGAMADHPLRIFYLAEKYAEAKAGHQASVWLIRTLFQPVRALALSMEDRLMKDLDIALNRLAEIARQGNLRGSSWKKSSMLTALDEVLRKINLQSEELNPAVLQAAAIEDMYQHIQRTRTLSGFKSGKKLLAACEAFVQIFFSDIYYGVYAGKPARLLNHEKVLRSAYHFYLQQHFRAKPLSAEEAQAEGLNDSNETE
ncbi:type I-D CRISPR-associated protein Cas10d/Csc3 [Herpetosiphon llansteffanensis]|uniref:type I-D CRISPR-associated protein Cas10d/Csc3 n=1 Tax=Herpetosiphon llansteffanensis TaxID=2094568 RepID=UPI000D7C609D|nr:type I-D CRISPR-associated protein Cas10d/Csc3 [Herpetosiphon llansteffanensis]